MFAPRYYGCRSSLPAPLDNMTQEGERHPLEAAVLLQSFERLFFPRKEASSVPLDSPSASGQRSRKKLS